MGYIFFRLNQNTQGCGIGGFKRAGKKEIFQKAPGSAVSRTREDKAGISSKGKALAQMSEEYLLLKKRTD